MAVELAYFKGGLELPEEVPLEWQFPTIAQSYGPQVATNLPLGRYELQPVRVGNELRAHTLSVYPNGTGEYTEETLPNREAITDHSIDRELVRQHTIDSHAVPIFVLGKEQAKLKVFYVVYYRGGTSKRLHQPTRLLRK